MLTPDLIPPVLNQDERRLAGLSRPALELEQSEISRQCFRRFLEDYGGHPHRPRQLPVIERHGINFEQKWLSSFSSHGQLVCVRYASQAGLVSAQRHFVVSADLTSGQINEWQVIDARYRYRPEGGGPIQTDLILSDGQLAETPAYPILTGCDAVADEIRLRHYQQQLVAADARAARVIMSPRGCWFKPIDGQPQALAPISELVADFEIRLPERLGRLALAAVPETTSDVA